MILYWTRISSLDEQRLRALRRLAAAIASPARRYRFPDDEARHLAGLGLAAYAFAAAGRDRPSCLPALRRGPGGKPFFLIGEGAESGERFEFNISHSGDYAVCLAGVGPVGVDIERIGKIPKEIADAHFTDAERRYLSRFSGTELDRAFFFLWSMKESYLKAMGWGLLDEPAGIEMIAPGGEPCRFFNGWCLAASDAFPGYSLAWCARPDERECEIVAVPPRETDGMVQLIPGAIP